MPTDAWRQPCFWLLHALATGICYGDANRDLARLARRSPPYFLAAVTIFKNECDVFEEWMLLHLSQGVEFFWLLDNNSTEKCREVQARFSEVSSITMFTGHAQ